MGEPTTFSGMYLRMMEEHQNRELATLVESGQMESHLQDVEKAANQTFRQIAGPNPTPQRRAEAREVVIQQMQEEIESDRSQFTER